MGVAGDLTSTMAEDKVNETDNLEDEEEQPRLDYGKEECIQYRVIK